MLLVKNISKFRHNKKRTSQKQESKLRKVAITYKESCTCQKYVKHLSKSCHLSKTYQICKCLIKFKKFTNFIKIYLTL